MIELHPDAAGRFNGLAEALIDQLAPAQPKPLPPGKFPIDYPIQATFRDSDIASFGPVKHCDRAGEEIERYYHLDDRIVVIAGEDYQRAKNLAGQIHRTKDFKNTVALETVLDSVLNWICSRSVGRDVGTLSGFVISECDAQIRDYTFLLPVHELYLQAPFTLGRVRLRPFAREEVDQWRDDGLVVNPEHRDAVIESSERMRRRFQGRAVAEFVSRADRRRALQMARQNAEESLSVLRMFAPAMFDVRLQSHCTLLGQERVQRKYEFEVEDAKLQGGSEALDIRTPMAWQISIEDVTWMNAEGLADFEALLDQETAFATTLLDAVLLHSRGSVERGLTEKLIYAVVALETLFLRNETEPIQTNVGERLAFVIGQDVVGRKEVIRVTKAAYGLRSKFLHHGQQVGDVELMNEFFGHLWSCLLTLTRNRGRWTTKEAMLDAVDDRRLA